MNKYLVGNILLGVGIAILIFSLARIIINYLKYRNIFVKKFNGYDIAKKVIDNNNLNNVNIVEVRDNSNLYNVRRKVVKLNTKTYNGSSIYDLASSLFISSYAVVDSKNNSFISFISKIFENIKIYSYSSYIVLGVSFIVAGHGFDRLGLIIFIVLFIYQYLVKMISNDNYNVALEEVEKIDKNNKDKILEILDSLNFNYNISLVITILQIVRVLIFIFF
jgi:Zn-dependent membrane protease YugP